jgi:hypothetical protein
MAESNKQSVQTEENKINPHGVRHPSLFPALLPVAFAVPNFHICRYTHITTGKSWAFNFGSVYYHPGQMTVTHYKVRHGTA